MAEDGFTNLKTYIIVNSPNQSREVPASDTFKWNDEQTNFLLGQYEIQIGNVGPMKAFRKKKNMWEYLCEQCSAEFGKQLTIEQVEGRFKTITKTARNRIKKNRTSGSIDKHVRYSGILNSVIYRNLPSSSRGFRQLDDEPRQRRGKCLHETMIDKIIADKKERHKENLEAMAKRHTELMDLLTKILAAETS